MTEMRTEILVVGGGLGGVAAALTAARLGRTVVLTEATDWLGGQLTAQAVPPDEHPWIEGSACPPGYAELRRRVRDYYRRNYPLRPDAAQDPLLDPGLGVVSRMCHEPRVAVAVIEEMLAPWRSSGAITVLTGYEPVAAHTDGDRIEAITLADRHDGREVTVHASYVADATELGDLLELADVEHVIGAEGRDETGEPHAPETADPLDQQAVSWCFALDYRPGEDHVIERPASYDHWRTTVAPFWPGPQLSFTDVVPITLQQRTWPLMGADRDAGEHFDLWQFRRILAREKFATGAFASDLTVANWPQIDYWEAPLLGVDTAARQAALVASRELSLSFLHWLQTEAPAPTAAPAGRACGCAPTSPAPRTAWPRLRTSANHAVSRPSSPFSNSTWASRPARRAPGVRCSTTVWVSAATASICTPAPVAAPISTSSPTPFRSRWAP